jgi:diguanylate cyclase (GGDEF)-like protein/PAS domain S-box-containing protein
VGNAKVNNLNPLPALLFDQRFADAHSMQSLLLERERDLLEAHRIAKLGTWRLNLTTDEVDWSAEVYRIFELDPALPPPCYAEQRVLYAAESWARVTAAVARTVETGEPYELDLELTLPDGQRKWISSRGEVEAWSGGEVASVRGTLREITERKGAEAELALSEARYRALIKATAKIVWSVTPQGAGMVALGEWQAFTGQSPEQELGFGWVNAIHPDDRQATMRAWHRALKDGTVFDVEHRLRRHDGVYRVMQARAVPVRDPAGEIVEWVGMHRDITELKKADDGRRRSEFSSMAELVIAGAPAAMFVTDATGLITYLNPAAEQLLLCKNADIVGRKTALFLFDRAELADRAAKLGKELGREIPGGLAVLTARPRNGIAETSEWQLRRGDGSRFDAQLSVSTLRYPSGEGAGLIFIATDISDRKRSAAHIFHLAHHDALTGLPTRRLLNQTLEALLHDRRANHGRLAVLAVDLDNFKSINDLHGHHAGDELIVHAARCLRGALRGSDMVARVGGDEFIVLLDHVQSQAAAERVARKLIEKLRAPIDIGGHHVTPTASIGISLFPHSGETAELLLKNADSAMYQVKADGGNDCKPFTDELAAILTRKRQVEAALRQAMERQEFRLVYQPQISLAGNRVTGMEALLRWESRELGPVSPDEFIPVAESCGMILKLGEWVLHRACQEGLQLQRETGRALTIAVNLSPRQFEDAGLIRLVAGVLAETGLEPHLLELEITESLLVKESSKILKILRALRARGVQIAIDDFCTGYCSLSYITRFPVDRLKIDKSFVANMNSRSGGAVIATIIALSRSLNITAIAEGIESRAQHNLLLDMGCGAGQGFLYAKPAALEDVPARIAQIEAALAVTVEEHQKDCAGFV